MLVELWKKGGAKYHEGLRLINEYAPLHPLLPILTKGESIVNQLYLEEAIESITFNTPQIKKSPSLPDLNKQLKELFHAKAIRRNEYLNWNLRNDDQAIKARAEINADLIKYRQKIHQFIERIKYFEKTGKLLKIPEDKRDKPTLKGNNFELQKQLQNIRSNISKYKAKIKKAYSQKEHDGLITKWEIKLKDLQNERDSIQNTLHSKTITKDIDPSRI